MDLEEFFESLDLDTIRQFIAEGRQEDNYLDFKLASDNSLNKDDKRNFAKALSGFANADGGILIWGVDARENEEKVDCAVDEKPIQNLARFMSELQSFTGQFVSPAVQGVRSKPIFTEDENAGFAVTLIPRSETTPHMAKGGEDRYYQRSGSSFHRMEHFQIEDMFGRRPHPKLELALFEVNVEVLTLTKKEIIDWRASVVLGLRNVGRGIAKYPFLHIKVEQPFQIDSYGLDGSFGFGLPRLIQAEANHLEASFSGTSNLVIYPNVDHRVVKLTCSHSSSQPPDLAMYYAITCEGSDIIEDEILILGNDLQQLAHQKKT